MMVREPGLTPLSVLEVDSQFCSDEFGFSDVHQLRNIQVLRRHRDHESVIFEVTCEAAPDLAMIVIDQASHLQIFHAERALEEQICLTMTGNHLCRIQADCSHKQTPFCLWLTTESHVFTSPTMPIQELIMCVPFCGGMSGWQHAVRMLQTCGYPIRTAIACDTSPEAVRSFCLTHGFGLGMFFIRRSHLDRLPTLRMPRKVSSGCLLRLRSVTSQQHRGHANPSD